MTKARNATFWEGFVKYFLEKNGGILVINKEKALKNQGLELREDIDHDGERYILHLSLGKLSRFR